MGAVLGVWERSFQPPKASKIFTFFCKNNLILGIFLMKNNALKRDIEFGCANMIKLAAKMGYVVGG